MATNATILVGRDDTVGLVTGLVRRTRRQLPILVLHGAGGVGKTAVLAEIERRCGHDIPVARVTVGTGRAVNVMGILQEAVAGFADYTHPEFGRLRFPRYELVRLSLLAHGSQREAEATATMLPESDGDSTGGGGQVSENEDGGRAAGPGTRGLPDLPGERHTVDPAPVLAKKLLAGKLVGLRLATDLLAAMGEHAPAPLPALMLPFNLLRPHLLALVLGIPSPLRRLFAPRAGGWFTWLEKGVGRDVLEFRPTRRAPEVVGVLWKLAKHRQWDKLDEILVRAFTDDVRSAYRFRLRRRANVVLLLDDVDRGDGDTLLSLLADRWAATPRSTRLLVVAASQAAPLKGTVVQDAPGPAGAAVLAAWRNRSDHAGRAGDASRGAAFLSVPLLPLGPEEIRRLLLGAGSLASRQSGEGELLEAFLHATRGHALAVNLLIRLYHTVIDETEVTPGSVRELFDMRAPVGYGTPGRQPPLVRDVLLTRFVQRFPETPGRSPAPGRADILRTLTVLGAPRRLDRDVTALLLPEENPTGVIRRLQQYSFVTSESDDSVVLHPLLRDLLAHSLVISGRHREIHEKLRDHAARTDDVLYHTLALGDLDAVVAAFAGRVGSDPTWPASLAEVTQAPMPPNRERPAPRSGDARTVAVHRLVRTLWDLRSVCPQTSSARSNTRELTEAAGFAFGACGDGPSLDEATRYRRMLLPAEPAQLVAVPTRIAATVRYPRGRLLPSRHVSRLATAIVLAVAFVGYSTVYAVHRVQHCDHEGPLAVGPVLHVTFDGRYALDKVEGGQCIGVTSRAGRFTASGDAYRDSWRNSLITKLWGQVEEENHWVEERVRATAGTQAPRSYITLILATQLSSRQEPPQFDLAVGTNELISALLGMRRWNRDPVRPPQILVRVHVANFGGESEFAMDVARQIRRIAEADPSVIGVIGLGQTRESTLSAVDYLGKPDTGRNWEGIAMIASTQSGDQLSAFQNYYRIGPPNTRQAVLGASWLQRTYSGAVPSLFVSTGDNYSTGLGGTYQNLLKIPQNRVFAFDAYDRNLRSTFAQHIRSLCNATPGNQKIIIVYTGRANEAVPLVEAVPDTTEHCARRTVILGGDDMMQTEDVEMAEALEGNPATVFYTTFGVTSESCGILPEDSWPLWTELQRRYEELRATELPGYSTEPSGHVQVAYDLLALLKELSNDWNGVPPTRQQFLGQLNALRGTDHRFYGVTGAIEIGTPEFPADGSPARTQLVALQQLGVNPDERSDRTPRIRTTFRAADPDSGRQGGCKE